MNLEFALRTAKVVPKPTPAEMAELDKLLLDQDGRMRIYPARTYDRLPAHTLQAWANMRGRYSLPTIELLNWLTVKINGRKAIEVGAGYGDIGSNLGIPMTDSGVQVRDPEVNLHYQLLGAHAINPPPDVIIEDAEEAVRSRRPDIVIASWVTNRYDPMYHNRGGNMYGPRHEYIYEHTGTFVLIGNDNVHAMSPLMQRPHQTIRAPWIRSRAKDPNLNAIYIWENPKWRSAT